MQSSHLKNLIELEIRHENPLESSGQIQEDKRHLIEDKIKQVKASQRQHKHRNNRHDFLNLILDNQTLILIQIILKSMDIKNRQSRHINQQSENRIREKIDYIKR